MTVHKSLCVAVGSAVLVVAALSGCSSASTNQANVAKPVAAAQTATPSTSRPAPPHLTPKNHTQTKPPAPSAPAVAAACATTPAGSKHVYVSISQQHLWACTGSTLITESAVTTGASALTNVQDATPVGTFSITSKSTHVTLAGSDVNGSWNDPVTYWMPFAGGDGFHDAPWQTFPLGSPLYPSKGSHGCVHVALPALATLYSWSSVGTPVTVTA